MGNLEAIWVKPNTKKFLNELRKGTWDTFLNDLGHLFKTSNLDFEVLKDDYKKFKNETKTFERDINYRVTDLEFKKVG